MQRTTIRLDQHLLIQVKEYAMARGQTFTAVVEEALRAQLRGRAEESGRNRARLRLPVSKEKGGFRPGIKTWEDVKRVLEEEELEKLGLATPDAASRR